MLSTDSSLATLCPYLLRRRSNDADPRSGLTSRAATLRLYPYKHYIENNAS